MDLEAWIEKQREAVDKLPLDTKTTMEDIRFLQGELSMLQKLQSFIKKMNKKDT